MEVRIGRILNAKGIKVSGPLAGTAGLDDAPGF